MPAVDEALYWALSARKGQSCGLSVVGSSALLAWLGLSGDPRAPNFLRPAFGFNAYQALRNSNLEQATLRKRLREEARHFLDKIPKFWQFLNQNPYHRYPLAPSPEENATSSPQAQSNTFPSPNSGSDCAIVFHPPAGAAASGMNSPMDCASMNDHCVNENWMKDNFHASDSIFEPTHSSSCDGENPLPDR